MERAGRYRDRVGVRVVEGSVGELHARDPFADGSPDGPELWWCRPTDTALVLGSRQGDDIVDRAACERAAVAVVRRRSGGGAVLVDPAATLWIDLVVPVGAVVDDVRAAMIVAGEWWRDAVSLATADPPALRVHRGAMVATAWSELVCFAGVGPGEVLVGDAKLVGLSQRRTRHGARIQGLLHRRRPSLDAADLLVGGPVGPVPRFATCAVAGDRLVAALAARIERITPV